MLKSRSCTVRIGNVVSLLLWTSKIFSSCALQTFLLPLTHNLAKVPPSAVLAFSRPSPSPSLLRSSIAQRRSPELHANGEIHNHVRTLRRSQTRQLSERSLERSFAAERNPGRVVALSTVKRSVEVHRFIIAHCTREIDCCSAALAECTWCKFDSSSLASWAREGTHGNHKMAIAELPPHKAFDRRWEKEEESWCSCDEGACHERTRARRPGRRGSEICKVSKRKFQLCQKNANSIFFWKPREWNAWLSVVQRV